MGPRVFLAPHISEKAGGMMSSEGETKYIFKVMPKANKIMVKKAVEDRYHVKVGSVHVMNMPEKKRRVGRIEGTKSGFKKAIVTLKEGGVIDAF
ncbi:50S ribosomal protein L23 [Candidatus Giovannonibacteria bacterium]|nr:50S ribosomal protein L23 [Candidatus Giovannonibacteria bacterium]